MKHSHPRHPHPEDHGDARIGRAFRRSLAVLVAAAGLAAAAWIATSLFQPGDVEPPERPVAGPVAPADLPTAPDPPPLPFTDVTAEAGIDFVHVSGAYGERLLPETMGSGGGFLDYDGDGDQDLLLVSATHWPGRERQPAPLTRLYANDGTGRFEDVTVEAGLPGPAYGTGLAVGDVDGDGLIDLYLTRLGENVLLRNAGGHFQDVTGSAGVAGPVDAWSTGAAFLDVDNDGDLDLYVVNYVNWSRDIDLEIDFRVAGLGRAYGAPDHFVAQHDRLYLNDGAGRFRDVSANAGIQVTDPASGHPVGKGLGVIALDYDADGLLDLFVANDTDRNFLLRNRGDGRFEETGEIEGIAYDRAGKATGAMGVDAAWFRNDAEVGVAVGNFAREMSSLFVTAEGRPPFFDEAMIEGIGPETRLTLTFGVFFFDADLDGRLDYFQANGHLEHEINSVQPSQTYEQPPQLFWNCGSACRSRFVPVAETGDLSRPLVGRGAAYADIDGDGDLDVLVTQTGRRAVLLRNDQRTGHHWLRVDLRGTRAHPSAIGARVELEAGGVTQRRLVMPTRSYLSQVELPVTFGLGTAERVDALRVVWPGGRVREVAVDGVDRVVVVREPGGDA